MYENLKLDGGLKHPDVDLVIEGIREGDLHKVASHMGNVLESVTVPHYPVIAQIKEDMMQAGALQAMMSGSGPTVFALFEDEGLAKQAYQKLLEKDQAKQVYLTDMFNVRE